MLSQGVKVGFEAWVEKADGRRFREYKVSHRGDTASEPSQTSCYIESKHGAVFVICVKILKTLAYRERRYDWSMHCTVDGLDIGAETATWANKTAKFTSMHLREDGQDLAADLVFGFLETTDDDSKVTLKGKELASIGKISIGLERGFTGDEYPMMASADAIEDIHVGVAHEKTKSFGTSVVPGTKRPVPRATIGMAWESMDEDFWHEFVFYHRTQFQLEKEKIIPRKLIPNVGGGSSRQQRPRRDTVNYHSTRAVDGSSDEDEDEDESDYETDYEHEEVEEVKEEIKPMIGQGEAGPSGSGKRKRPMVRTRPRTAPGDKVVVDLTGLDSDSD